MQVGHRLTGIVPVVDHEPVARFRNTEAPAQIPSHRKEVSNERCIGIFYALDRHYRLARNDEDMNRRLRIDVPKRDAVVV